MFRRASSGRMHKSGVKKIRRDTYNTVNGMSKKNGWWEISAAVRKRDNNQCVDCRLRGILTKCKDVHHLIPLSRGGTTTMGNLMCLCATCHEKRHNHMYRARKL